MIVILGRPGLGAPSADGERPLGGLAALVAVEAARRGARVELVGSIGEDAGGDQVAVALGRANVGHAALLRDPAGTTPQVSPGSAAPTGTRPRLDAGDVELGLRYLSECRVLVIADTLDERAATVAMEAAAYHGAPVVAVVSPGGSVPGPFERGATVLEAPGPDEDGEPDLVPFATFLAGFAVALADGAAPREAMARAASGGGWERAEA